MKVYKVEEQDLNIFLVSLLKSFYSILTVYITLEDHFFEVATIYISVNGIISNRNSPDFDHVLKSIKNIVQKCRSYGI